MVILTMPYKCFKQLIQTQSKILKMSKNGDLHVDLMTSRDEVTTCFMATMFHLILHNTHTLLIKHEIIERTIQQVP